VPDIFFFQDEDEAPRPPERVEIVEMQVHPLPDGRRVVVQVTLTPFIEYPSFDLTLLRPDGTEERSLSVVSTMERTTALTMHMARPDPTLAYTARVALTHEGRVLQTREASFAVPAPANSSG
jgi:hypothetical protein